jgi:tol-pal system protein YbgF
MRIIGVAVLFLAVGAAGCAQPDLAADRHFAELREQVSKMEADRDQTNARLEQLEENAADKRRAQDSTKKGDGPAQPRSVQLGGADETEAEIGDATGRPEIKVQGAPGSSPRGARGKSSVRESDTSSSIGDGPRSSATDPDAKRAYEAALAQVQGKQYDKGLAGLTSFLARWPDHPYAENALYWRGEAYYAQGEYLRAAEQFESVIARYAGAKTPDALLKLGLCHDRLGAPARAREYWDRLKSEFPKSDAARRIPGARQSSESKVGPKENR